MVFTPVVAPVVATRYSKVTVWPGRIRFGVSVQVAEVVPVQATMPAGVELRSDTGPNPAGSESLITRLVALPSPLLVRVMR